MENQIEDASVLIDALGGTGEVARTCQVSEPSVSQWRKRGIPRPWQMFLRERYPERFDADGRVVAFGAAVDESEVGKAVALGSR
ncbi:hypothetical protein [Stenotrophomonas sp. UBA7606]|uniref:hypothetical protein n=1 Tax=Stenotrophomonas sp. UBA7606 TaxID=1947559 RepID=UPI0025DFF39A|nr:hypothetical protein [Stenotrophomonas sp. UBA7606]